MGILSFGFLFGIGLACGLFVFFCLMEFINRKKKSKDSEHITVMKRRNELLEDQNYTLERIADEVMEIRQRQ